MYLPLISAALICWLSIPVSAVTTSVSSTILYTLPDLSQSSSTQTTVIRSTSGSTTKTPASNTPSTITGISSTTAAPSKSTPSPSSIATHSVLVGVRDHIFDPDVIHAQVGDIVQFMFFPANHSVVRAEYLHPCVPWEVWHPAYNESSAKGGQPGFFSGFTPVDSTEIVNPPSWQIQVDSSEPMFFYCSALGSCPNYQMVGVINPNSTESFERHKKIAGQARYSLQPGQVSNSTEMEDVYGIEHDSNRVPVNPRDTIPPSSTPPSLSVGAIVGIAIGLTIGTLGFTAWAAIALRARLARALASQDHHSYLVSSLNSEASKSEQDDRWHIFHAAFTPTLP